MPRRGTMAQVEHLRKHPVGFPACYKSLIHHSPEATMRLYSFVLFMLCLGAGSASAWTEYNYLDQGVAIQFPVKPTEQKSTFDSIYGKALPSMVYAAQDDHVRYSLTVVDLAGHPDMGTNFVNEVGYWLMRKGDVLFTDFPRVYQDARSIFGITLVVDRTDGSRARTSIFYHKGKLYVVDATVLPSRADKDMTTPSRYDQTIRFPPDGRFD
jgi:hypothetical protein